MDLSQHRIQFEAERKCSPPFVCSVCFGGGKTSQCTPDLVGVLLDTILCY